MRHGSTVDQGAAGRRRLGPRPQLERELLAGVEFRDPAGDILALDRAGRIDRHGREAVGQSVVHDDAGCRRVAVVAGGEAERDLVADVDGAAADPGLVDRDVRPPRG